MDNDRTCPTVQDKAAPAPIAPDQAAQDPQEPQEPNGADAYGRIVELLSSMGPQKESLLAIVDFCREERTSAEIDAMLAPLQADRCSVYSPITMRSLLEEAGALEFNDRDDAPEEEVDEDGNLVIPERTAEGTWLATACALQVFEDQDPFADLVAALGERDEYADVYAQIIELCAAEACSISRIEQAVDESGRLEGTELQAGFFVGKLEDIGAIAWHGAWEATELGERYLGLAAADR